MPNRFYRRDSVAMLPENIASESADLVYLGRQSA